MTLTDRQKNIVEIIKQNEPITGDNIAKLMGLTRSALRTDFSILKKVSMIKSKQKIGYSYNKEFIEVENLKLVSDIMGEPITVEENYSVYETILLMFGKDIGTIFITKNEELSGVVSRKDLLRATIGKRDIEKIPINMIMTRMPNIIYGVENESIESCVKKIIEHQIDSLPVIRIIKKNDKQIYKVVGRFTKTNITKILLEIFQTKNIKK